MTLLEKQLVTGAIGVAVASLMLLFPPWSFIGYGPEFSTARVGPVVAPLWLPPEPPPDTNCWPVVSWGRLRAQWLVVLVGAVLLMYLREARERSRSAADAGSPDGHRASPSQ